MIVITKKEMRPLLVMVGMSSDDIALLRMLIARNVTSMSVVVGGKGNAANKMKWLLEFIGNHSAVTGKWRLYYGHSQEDTGHPTYRGRIVDIEEGPASFDPAEFKVFVEQHGDILCAKPVTEFLMQPEGVTFPDQRLLCTMDENFVGTDGDAHRLIAMFPAGVLWVKGDMPPASVAYQDPTMASLQRACNTLALSQLYDEFKQAIVVFETGSDSHSAGQAVREALEAVLDMLENRHTVAPMTNCMLVPLYFEASLYLTERVRYTGNGVLEPSEEGTVYSVAPQSWEPLRVMLEQELRCF
jgi:hypothetical protein